MNFNLSANHSYLCTDFIKCAPMYAEIVEDALHRQFQNGVILECKWDHFIMHKEIFFRLRMYLAMAPINIAQGKEWFGKECYEAQK